jgi:hypothetical protein
VSQVAFRAEIKKRVSSCPGARGEILDWERENAAGLRALNQLSDKNKHKKPCLRSRAT